MDHDGAVELAAEPGFIGRAEVVAVFEGLLELTFFVRFVEHRRGFVIAQAREGRHDAFELLGIAADDGQLCRAIFEHALHDVREEVFGEDEQAVEIAVSDLGLDHPELGEVAAGLGLLGAEGGAEAVDLAQGERRGLNIELAGLGEKRGVAEVVHREEGGGAFAGGGREDGRIGADEAVGVEVLLGGAHDLGADTQDGRLTGRAHPEVPALHEEVDAVLLGRDGVRVGLGDALDDVDVFDVELEAAGGALVGADFAGDDDGRLLREALERVKNGGGYAAHVGHALHGAGAVAKDGKEQLAALARVIEPSANGDGLALVFAELGDGDNGRGGRGGFRRCGGGGGFFRHGVRLAQRRTGWACAGRSRITREGWPRRPRVRRVRRG